MIHFFLTQLGYFEIIFWWCWSVCLIWNECAISHVPKFNVKFNVSNDTRYRSKSKF